MRWWIWVVGALASFALALFSPWTWLSALAALAALFALFAAAFALLDERIEAGARSPTPVSPAQSAPDEQRPD